MHSDEVVCFAPDANTSLIQRLEKHKLRDDIKKKKEYANET